MKQAILAQRRPYLLLGGLLTGLLVASSVVLPTAHAADQYFFDFSLAEDLSFKASLFVGTKEYLSGDFGTTDSKQICEKLKSEKTAFANKEKRAREDTGFSSFQVEDCKFIDSYFFIEYTGKWDEKLLKKTSPGTKPKINAADDLSIQVSNWSSRLIGATLSLTDDVHKLELARFKFPGKIKNVTPRIGKISGNTWTLEYPSTDEQKEKVIKSWSQLTITGERYGSKLGLILGITIPAALIIVAVIVLLIARNKRKKKQENLPQYTAGSGTYPPPPFMPGNSPYPTQPQVPGYPAAPGAPGMPGAAPYPPNVPPQAQPGTPMPGGNYPYPYPYPPANPQGSQTGYPMPPQGYGTPTSGFQPPATPPQPAAGQPGNPYDSNQATPAEQPGQEK